MMTMMRRTLDLTRVLEEKKRMIDLAHGWRLIASISSLLLTKNGTQTGEQ